jgi:hypothetical protein
MGEKEKGASMKNYTFVHDYAVIVITASTKRIAENTLKELVIEPSGWVLE